MGCCMDVLVEWPAIGMWSGEGKGESWGPAGRYFSGDWTRSTAAGPVWSGLREGGIALESLTSSLWACSRECLSLCGTRDTNGGRALSWAGM